MKRYAERRPGPSGVLLILLLLTACSSNAPGQAGEGAPVADTLGLRLVERIGSVDDPDQILTSVRQVFIGPGERLYVAQPADDKILIFGPEEPVPLAVGRRGEGPGEFGSLHSMGLLADTLWAFDSSGPRLVLFSMDGEPLGTRPWTTETFSIGEYLFVPRVPVSLALLPDGGALASPGLMIRAQPPGAGVEFGSMRSPVPRMGRDAEIRDTVVWTRREGTTVGIARGGTVGSFSVPFSDAPFYSLMPAGQGVAVVDRRRPGDGEEPRFRITLLDPMGDTAFAVAVPYDPVPLTPDALDRIVSRVRPFPPPDRGGLSPAEVKTALTDRDLVPANHVAVTSLVGTQDGRIWVRREEARADSVAWNMFDGEGVLQGTVLLANDHEIKAAQGDLLVVLERDQLDVPYLLKFRLDEGG